MSVFCREKNIEGGGGGGGGGGVAPSLIPQFSVFSILSSQSSILNPQFSGFLEFK